MSDKKEYLLKAVQRLKAIVVEDIAEGLLIDDSLIRDIEKASVRLASRIQTYLDELPKETLYDIWNTAYVVHLIGYENDYFICYDVEDEEIIEINFQDCHLENIIKFSQTPPFKV